MNFSWIHIIPGRNALKFSPVIAKLYMSYNLMRQKSEDAQKYTYPLEHNNTTNCLTGLAPIQPLPANLKQHGLRLSSIIRIYTTRFLEAK
jgi:hypothetical protein